MFGTAGVLSCADADEDANVLVPWVPDRLNATTASPVNFAPTPSPPVATTAMYCCPLASAYEIGVDSAEAGSFTVQTSLPVLVSKARNRASSVAPTKTRPPPVTIAPPRPG